MRFHLSKMFGSIALQCLVGCAALITGPGTDVDELIHVGTTEDRLVGRLGPPIRKGEVAVPVQAIQLWEKDHAVSLLSPRDTAVSESIFKFAGRLGSKEARAGQAGFDSFMTLGLAEIFLIPKALWERTVDEDIELTVWFNSGGQALAYKWSPKPKQQPPPSQ